jgi:hypothetical protein
MHPIQSEAGYGVVQPVRLVVGARNRLVLHGNPGLAEQAIPMTVRCSSSAGMLTCHIGVEALRPGSSTTGGPVDGPSNRYARTVPNEIGKSDDSLTGGSSAMAAW